MCKEFPTVLFSSIAESDDDTKCVELIKVVREQCKDKANATLGIAGYPNVGKTALQATLNKFLLAKKDQDEYKGLKLLENVGVVFGQDNPNSVILKNVKYPDDLSDPYVPVHAIIKRVPKHELLLTYEIADFANTQEFLASVAALKKNFLKGGLPDYDSTAKMVLNDWIAGKIKYHQDLNMEEDDEKDDAYEVPSEMDSSDMEDEEKGKKGKKGEKEKKGKDDEDEEFGEDAGDSEDSEKK